MLVCHCRAVNDRAVAACVAGGARSVDELADRCGAGGRCGGCRPLLEELLADALSADVVVRASRRPAA